MSTKSQEAKDRCEEQNEELRELKVGLKSEEEMLGDSKEVLTKGMISKGMLTGSKEMLNASRSLRGSNQLLQLPDASPSR